MDVKILIQGTPNPNALKFVVNQPVKTSGNVTYKSEQDCEKNPLAASVFRVSPHIKEVYFFDNYITVSQDGLADWDDLEGSIRETILNGVPDHTPDFEVEEKVSEHKPKIAEMTPEVKQINAILDQTVRPALQMDGGDIDIISYDQDVLTVFYQGACGSCPSASMGTMKAIENILRDQFNPEIVVEIAEDSF